MKNIKRYKSIVVALATLASVLVSGAVFAAGVPTVTTVATSSQDVSSTSAIIKATAWPNGADTQVWFKYSTSATLSGAIQPSCFPTVPANVTNQTVPCTISGLTPNTTYYFRAYASNANGPAAQATIYSFTTTSGGGSNGNGTGTGNCTVDDFLINGQNSATIAPGNNATLSWHTSNCSTVTLSGGGMSNVSEPVDGQITIAPSGVGTYTFTLKADGIVTTTRVLTVSNGGGNGTGSSCVISSFTINGVNASTSMNYSSGMQVPLVWHTSGCTDVSITGGGMNNAHYPANSMIYIAPSAPGNYSFTLTGNGGTNPTALRVLTLYGGGGSGTGTTGSQNCSIDSFTAFSTQVTSGGSTNLGWGTSNCTSVSISGIGSVSLDGSTSTGAIYSTTTFTLTAYGPGGPITASRTVNVIQNQHCDITNFNASALSVSQGDAVVLSWASQNCTSISIQGNGISGSYSPNSSVTIYPNSTSTYTVTGYGQSGSNDSASITIYVNQIPQQQYNCQINYFNANQNYVSAGGSTTLTWGTQNCSNAYVSGPGVWSSGSNGSVNTGAINGSATFTLTAYGTGGSQTSSVTVYTNGVPNPNQNTCVISNFYASPSSVLRGNSTTIYWNTTGNCSYATLTNMSGYVSNVPVNGSQNSGTMNILGTRTFTLRVYDTTGAPHVQTVNVQVYQNGVVQNNYACSDGYDNDGDGLIDGNDPGCTSSTDNSEFNSTTVTTNNTGTTTGGVNGISIVTNPNGNYTAYQNRGNLTGLALFSGITLPGTFVGWLVLIIILVLIVLLLRNIIGYAPVHGNHASRPTGTDGHH